MHVATAPLTSVVLLWGDLRTFVGLIGVVNIRIKVVLAAHRASERLPYKNTTSTELVASAIGTRTLSSQEQFRGEKPSPSARESRFLTLVCYVAGLGWRSRMGAT